MRFSTYLLFVFLWFSPVSASAVEDSPKFLTVTEVINGKSFKVDSGDTVRMASLQVPNVEEKTGKRRPGDPLGEESKAELARLVLGKAVRLETGKEPRDRKNRIVAQAYLKDGTWVQESMLRSGYAMVYPIFEDSKKGDLEKMLAAEQEARAAKKGIWAHPDYQVLDAKDALCCVDKFRIVRGAPLDIEARRGNIYLNFGEDWKSDFTAFIPKRYARSFVKAGIENMVGKTIELRGWIEEKDGPMMELVRPEQVKVVK